MPPLVWAAARACCAGRRSRPPLRHLAWCRPHGCRAACRRALRVTQPCAACVRGEAATPQVHPQHRPRPWRRRLRASGHPRYVGSERGACVGLGRRCRLRRGREAAGRRATPATNQSIKAGILQRIKAGNSRHPPAAAGHGTSSAVAACSPRQKGERGRVAVVDCLHPIQQVSRSAAASSR